MMLLGPVYQVVQFQRLLEATDRHFTVKQVIETVGDSDLQVLFRNNFDKIEIAEYDVVHINTNVAPRQAVFTAKQLAADLEQFDQTKRLWLNGSPLMAVVVVDGKTWIFAALGDTYPEVLCL